VLRVACADNVRWQNENYPDISVSVNLSARQFVQEDLLSKISGIIDEYHIKAENLELELTESLIMPNTADILETLNALKERGVTIAIDDFGTGYSSLSYLKRFPIDVLKIDQSFVFDLGEDAENTALVTAIIVMAQKLHLKVVAEGVETPEQLYFLTQHGCDYIQGYLFGKPIPAKLFQTLLDDYKLTMGNYAQTIAELLDTTPLEEWTDYNQV